MAIVLFFGGKLVCNITSKLGGGKTRRSLCRTLYMLEFVMDIQKRWTLRKQYSNKLEASKLYNLVSSQRVSRTIHHMSYGVFLPFNFVISLLWLESCSLWTDIWVFWLESCSFWADTWLGLPNGKLFLDLCDASFSRVSLSWGLVHLATKVISAGTAGAVHRS